MTKKLTILFAILTAVCMVAAIPLIPFAVRDTSNMLISQVNALQDMHIISEFEIPDGITHLDITEDGYTSFIRITHSNEKKVTISSNGISLSETYIDTSNTGNTLSLLIRNATAKQVFPENAQQLRVYLAKLWNGERNPTIEIAIPDGLVLSREGRNLSGLNRWTTIDSNVRYLTSEDLLEPATPDEPSVSGKQDFAQRVEQLRSDLIQLVRNNAEGGYDQLDFNMNLNDCRIRMEALLMEYAKEEGLINYGKYDAANASSSSVTGISGVSGKNKIGIQMVPYDDSLDESEARSLIHELCSVYLSRLTVQAKLDRCITEMEEGSEDPALTESKAKYESQINDYTVKIQELEDSHTDFIMSLMDTGLLF